MTATAATLAGTLTPGGLDTTYHFAYGSSATALTSVTPTLDAGAATSGSVPVSTALSGLMPDHSYYFELVATNSSGTATGAPLLFTTSALALASTSAATSITAISATLNGSVTPGGLPTTYWFEYGTSPTTLGSRTADFQAGAVASGSVPVSVPLSGLKPQATYYVRLVARNSAGTSYGAEAYVTTAGAAAATTGSASSIGSTSATLGGSVDPAGLPTTYWFVYGPSRSSLGSSTAHLSAGSDSQAVPVTVAVSGLKTDETYLFRLVQSNSSGTTDGALELFTTSGPSVSATTGQASAVGSTTATFSGSVDPGGLPATYRFAYGSTASGFTSVTARRDAGSGSGSVAVTATVAGLKPDTDYAFRLTATNASGTAEGVSGLFTTAAAGAPTVTTAADSDAATTSLTVTGTVNPNGTDDELLVRLRRHLCLRSKTAVGDAASGTTAA